MSIYIGLEREVEHMTGYEWVCSLSFRLMESAQRLDELGVSIPSSATQRGQEVIAILLTAIMDAEKELDEQAFSEFETNRIQRRQDEDERAKSCQK